MSLSVHRVDTGQCTGKSRLVSDCSLLVMAAVCPSFGATAGRPPSRSCTKRWAPKPSAAPSTAAGATSDPMGRPSWLAMSIATTMQRTAIATEEITDVTARRCLTLSAPQHGVVASPPVEAPADAARDPDG